MDVIAYFTKLIFPKFLEIITSPFNQPEMLWAIAPLLISLLFMEIYFGRWKNEKLGWNSAFANSVVLLFVTINLFHILWTKYSTLSLIPFSILTKFILVIAIMMQAVILMLVVYLHALPRRLSYFVGSPLTINLLAFLAIVLVYSNIDLNLPALFASLLVYIILVLIFTGIKVIIPPSSQAKHYLKGREKRNEKNHALENKRRKRF